MKMCELLVLVGLVVGGIWKACLYTLILGLGMEFVGSIERQRLACAQVVCARVHFKVSMCKVEGSHC